MLSPNAETIEAAAENLRRAPVDAGYPTLTEFMLKSQLKELDAFGAERANDLASKQLPAPAQQFFETQYASDAFRWGYLLGLQAARITLTGSVALAKAGIKPSEVL